MPLTSSPRKKNFQLSKDTYLKKAIFWGDKIPDILCLTLIKEFSSGTKKFKTTQTSLSNFHSNISEIIQIANITGLQKLDPNWYDDKKMFYFEVFLNLDIII